MASLNETSAFYKGSDASLFWEMTICQSLSDRASPYMGALREAFTFGELLMARLYDSISLGSKPHIIEVGGGYGTLMRSILPLLPTCKVTMVELSPRFADLQRRVLSGFPLGEVIEGDIFEVLRREHLEASLFISNENIGDFPTAEGLRADEISRIVEKGVFDDSVEGRAARLISRYNLHMPDDNDPFAFNLGALEYVELLKGRAETVFLSEHSADIELGSPWSDFLTPTATGRPRRISLKGHAEYSIRFGDLESAALAEGWQVAGFPQMERLKVRDDAGARFMAVTECVGNERSEIIHEFLNHVKEYECLILKR